MSLGKKITLNHPTENMKPQPKTTSITRSITLGSLAVGSLLLGACSTTAPQPKSGANYVERHGQVGERAGAGRAGGDFCADGGRPVGAH